MRRRQFVATLSGLTAALVAGPFVMNGTEKNLEGYASLEVRGNRWYFRPMDKQSFVNGDYIYIDIPQRFHGNGITAPTCFKIVDEIGRREYRIVPIENIYVVRARQVSWVMKVKYVRVNTYYAEGPPEWTKKYMLVRTGRPTPYRYLGMDRGYNMWESGGKAFYDKAKFPYIIDEVGKTAFA